MIDEEVFPLESDDHAGMEKDLFYNEERGTYELDMADDDPDWDHPADYSTLSLGAEDDNSTYDVSNPFVGSEYSDLENLQEEELEQAHMRIADKRILKTATFDRVISADERTESTDLDQEGYPVNT